LQTIFIVGLLRPYLKISKMIIQRNKTAARPSGLSTSKAGPSLASRVSKTTNQTRMATQLGVLGSGGDTVTFTMANATGAVVTYVLGDAQGAVAQQLGKTAVSPTSSNVFTPAILKARYGLRPVQVSSINLQTSSTSAQFAQPITYGYIENDGTAASKPIVVGVFESPSDYNALIRPVDFRGFSMDIILGPDTGLFFNVLAGETLTAYVVYGAQTV
jgi:hypothetical protein